MAKRSTATSKDSTATIGFDTKLWLAEEPERSGDSQPQATRRVRLRRQQPKQNNATTRCLAIMNLTIRGIEADIGLPPDAGPSTFRCDLHPDLRADHTIINGTAYG